MAKKYPYFHFFASDWLGSNARAGMTLEQQAAYINLLCRQWSDPTCSLPDDDGALAKLSEMGERWLQNGSQVVRQCFPQHPNLKGRLANKKLLGLYDHNAAWSAKSAKGGRKSRPPKQLRAEPNGNQTGTKAQPKPNQTGTKVEPPLPLPEPSPEPQPEPGPKPKQEASTEAVDACPALPKTADAGPMTGYVFPTKGKGGKSWTLPQPLLEEYQEAYPDLDVEAEIRKARQWVLAKPRRQKTAGGMQAYLTGWLNRVQNRGTVQGSHKEQADGHYEAL